MKLTTCTNHIKHEHFNPIFALVSHRFIGMLDIIKLIVTSFAYDSIKVRSDTQGKSRQKLDCTRNRKASTKIKF